MTESLIALGANLPTPEGGPRETLERALALLGATPGVAVRRVAGWVASPAFPAGSGPDFVNGAAVLETRLDPPVLLAALHGVEARLGRVRMQRWGPRACDLDLLAVGDAVLPDAATVRRWMEMGPEEAGARVLDGVVLPHPRLHQRAFVLVPLSQVAPGWRHPLTGQTVAEMLAALPAAARAEVVPL